MLYRSLSCHQNNFDPSGHKIRCGIWHQVVTRRSFKLYNLQGGAFMDHTCQSRTSHRHSIRLRSGEFGGQIDTLIPLSNHSQMILQWIWVHYPAYRGHCHQGILHLQKFLVDVTYQSDTQMNASTQGFFRTTMLRVSHVVGIWTAFIMFVMLALFYGSNNIPNENILPASVS